MMNNKLIIVGLGIILIAGVVFYFVKNKAVEEPTVPMAVVSRPDIRLEFSYKNGVDGYNLKEGTETLINVPTVLRAFVLTKKVNPPPTASVPGENPPSIGIFVLNEPEEASTTATSTASTTPPLSKLEELKAIATDYQNLTSINLATSEVELVKVDGVTGIHYKTDGLYPQNVYLLNTFGKIYLMVGQSLESSDKMADDFNDLISSVTFL